MREGVPVRREKGPAVLGCIYEEQSWQRRILRGRFFQPALLLGNRTPGRRRRRCRLVALPREVQGRRGDRV